jgi:hypothetical protein
MREVRALDKQGLVVEQGNQRLGEPVPLGRGGGFADGHGHEPGPGEKTGQKGRQGVDAVFLGKEVGGGDQGTGEQGRDRLGVRRDRPQTGGEIAFGHGEGR